MVLLYIYDMFLLSFFFFFKQKTSYEMRISDWSSDVCSSDLLLAEDAVPLERQRLHGVQHAAVALAVDVLHGELVGAQLVGALVGVGTGLRHVESEGHRRVAARIVAEVGAEGVPHEEGGRCDGAAARRAEIGRAHV